MPEERQRKGTGDVQERWGGGVQGVGVKAPSPQSELRTFPVSQDGCQMLNSQLAAALCCLETTSQNWSI